MNPTPTPHLKQTATILAIPQPKARFAVRFQRIEHFSVEVLARNADEACAEAVFALQTQQGKARLLTSLLDYFTVENLNPSQGA